MKHKWFCDECDVSFPFRQPELQEDDPLSEENESSSCPYCDQDMYYDDDDDDVREEL